MAILRLSRLIGPGSEISRRPGKIRNCEDAHFERAGCEATAASRMGEVGLLMGKCGGPGRRAGFEGISGLAALALEMPQDAINHACISNNGDNLHLSAAGTQHGINFKNLAQQARPCAASFLGELRVLVGPGGLCCGAGEILRHSGGYSRPVAIGPIRASSMLAGIGDMRGNPVDPIREDPERSRFRPCGGQAASAARGCHPVVSSGSPWRWRGG